MVRPGSESAGACGSCGNDLRARARFCDICGASVSASATAGEHKHVTVLFADVVGSMRLASTLDDERLREIMNTLFNRSAAVVQRYQGTMDKFTGDGLMALFGAPLAMEDHALRACIAALEIQAVAAGLAGEVHSRDGIDLQIRVGLNSGEVIVGEIGSGPGRYTAVGHAVGMAQRMETAAPAGAVLCSISTARLVENSTRLGPAHDVYIKGSDKPVTARQLIAVEARRMVVGRNEGLLFGRGQELAQLHRLLDEDQRGGPVAVIGAPGVGKSRLVDEYAAQLAGRGVDVAVAYCDAHAMQIAFRALNRFLRALFAVDGLANRAARERAATLAQLDDGASPADAAVLFDAMGIADPSAPALQVGVDGWRHRLVEIMVRSVRARSGPVVFILEDAHWLDPASDAVLAEFADAIADISAVFIATGRPEFVDGALRQRSDRAVIVAPLDDPTTTELVGNLLGRDASLADLATRIARVAAGNPFFAEEIVRDLAGRGVLVGGRGGYRLLGAVDDIGVPATVQAVLASRIDRLPVGAKSVLNAAAVIGTRFDVETLNVLVPEPFTGQLAELVANELIDQTEFTPRQRYCFRHPLVRTVAYESQLTVTRVQAHHRLAYAIEDRDRDGADENASLIATHLEASGDLVEACRWHLRAADWLRPRDMLAARAQWLNALRVADELPSDRGDLIDLRIAPRAMLVSIELFTGSDPDNDARFAELRDLAGQVGDFGSLAIAMAGRIMTFSVNGRRVSEVKPLAAELEEVVEKLDNAAAEEIEILYTAITFAYMDNCDFAAMAATLDKSLALKLQAPTIDRAVAYALRGLTELCHGRTDRGIADLRTATSLAREMSPVSFSAILVYWGIAAGMNLYVADEMLDDMRDALRRSESFGDRFGIVAAQWVYGTVLLRSDPASRTEAISMLELAAANSAKHDLQSFALGTIVSDLAADAARRGRLDEAIERLREQVLLHSNEASFFYIVSPAEALIELLTQRNTAEDRAEAAQVVELWRSRRPDAPAMNLWWLKSQALLAEARGDAPSRLDFAQQYLAACESFGVDCRLAEARRMVTVAG